MASAKTLESKREIFEANDVFSPRMIDDIIRQLRYYDDLGLREKVAANPEEALNLVRQL